MDPDEDVAGGGSPSGGWATARDDLQASGAALLASFRSRDLGRALIAYLAISLLEWGGLISLFVYAYRVGGVAAVGSVALLQQLPAAVVASFGSVLGDRFDRRRVLLLTFAIITILAFGAGCAMLLGAPTAVSILLGCSAGWFLGLVRPTYGALLPWIVTTPQELTNAFAANGLIESTSTFLGPLLVGGVMALRGGEAGPGTAFVCLGILLLAGTILVARMHASNVPAEGPEAERLGFKELTAGFTYALGEPRRRLLVGLIAGGALMVGIVDGLVVVLALEVLRTGDAGVGFLNAAFGVGAVAGATIALVAAQRPRLFPAFRAGLVSSGVPLLAVAAAPVAAAPMLAVAGAGIQLLDVTGVTMLQRIVPDEKLSRTFGVLESFYTGLDGLGAFLASAAVVALGARWTLVGAGALLPFVGFAIRRRIASLDVGMRVPVEEIATLRRTELFAPLPTTSLERLARDLVPLDAAAGTVLIREGARGDRFYLIDRGEVVVTRGGREQRRLDAGDHFGEIALLYDQPRNATVTAATDVRLLVLERDEFLRAVTGHDGVGAVARRVAAARSAPERDD